MGRVRLKRKMANRTKPCSSRWKICTLQFLFDFLKWMGMCRSFIKSGWKGWTPWRSRNHCTQSTAPKNQLPTVWISNGDQSDHKTRSRFRGHTALATLLCNRSLRVLVKSVYRLKNGSSWRFCTVGSLLYSLYSWIVLFNQSLICCVIWGTSPELGNPFSFCYWDRRGMTEPGHVATCVDLDTLVCGSVCQKSSVVDLTVLRKVLC